MFIEISNLPTEAKDIFTHPTNTFGLPPIPSLLLLFYILTGDYQPLSWSEIEYWKKTSEFDSVSQMAVYSREPCGACPGSQLKHQADACDVRFKAER